MKLLKIPNIAFLKDSSVPFVTLHVVKLLRDTVFFVFHIQIKMKAIRVPEETACGHHEGHGFRGKPFSLVP